MRQINQPLETLYRTHISPDSLGVGKYTMGPGTTTMDITIGYGIIFIADWNTGGYALYAISNGNSTKISSLYDANISITRKNSSEVTVTCSNNNNSGLRIKIFLPL